MLACLSKHDISPIIASWHLSWFLNWKLHSPRETLTNFNRLVNMYGGAGNNISLDLALEFLNKEVKPNLKNVTHLTDQVGGRVGKVGKICCEVVNNFEEYT